MKKLLTTFTVLLFLLPLRFALAQSANENGKSNGRENWFPNRGNVGIGTRSPSENLEVKGNVRVSENIFTNSLQADSISSESLRLSGNGVVNGYLGLGVSSPSERLDILGNLKLSGNIFAHTLNIESLNSNNGTFSTLTVNQNAIFNGLTSFNENVSFSKDALITGRLGIGISDPSEALDVLGNIKSSSDISVGNNLTVTGASQLKGGTSITGNSSVTGNFQVSGILNSGSFSTTDINATGSAIISQNLTVSGISQFGDNLNVAGNIKGGIIEATEFKITGGGSPFNFNNAVIAQTLNVGAERVPENYKMAIGGKIIATGIDIKIPQKWPDYVFTEKHQLMTLQELQEYIDKHGHLPGIASAKEMEEKQIYSVSEMDGKLLEKIEELTLYILELKKEVDRLKNEIPKK